MKKIVVFVLAFMALCGVMVMSAPPTPTAAVDDLLCVPNVPTQVDSEIITIDVGFGETVTAKIFWPNAGAGNRWKAGSLGAVAMTHGFPGSFASLENDAAALSRLCLIVLIWNHRGQGPTATDDSLFHFWSGPERDDLVAITDALVAGPPSLTDIELVDTNRLGIIGFSQGGIVAWLVTADYRLRGRYRVAIPWDGDLNAPTMLVPNRCLIGNLSQFFDPQAFRTPGSPPNNAVSWNDAVFNTLRAALLTHTPNAPVWATEVATRSAYDELLPVTATGVPAGVIVPHPNVYAQVGHQDTQQLEDEVLKAWGTLTPPAAPQAGYPNKHILLGVGGHADSRWISATEEAYRHQARTDWLMDFIGPVYVHSPTPSPTFTPGGVAPTNTPTPFPTPRPFEVVVDSYNPNQSIDILPVPTYTHQGASVWPPSDLTQVTLYLRNTGGSLQALTTAPGAEGYQTIEQTYSAGSPPWNMGTAIAEEPAFDTWESHFTVVSKIYTSLPLAQDVTLVDVPRVYLYTDPTTYVTYQVHVRVLEKLANGQSAFITRTDACAWNASTPPSEFNGGELKGEMRVHQFKAGDRILIEVAPIEKEEYWTSMVDLAIVPYLGDFQLRIWHEVSASYNRPSQVILPLVKSDPLRDIFDTGAGPGGGPRGGQASAPAAPLPLGITAVVYPEFTNPGGWRAWAPKVTLICSGGEGEVECPETTYLESDGANQSFSFTATDAEGNSVTATVPNVSIDRTAPVLTLNLPPVPAACAGTTMLVDFTASDALSGLASTQATFNSQIINDGDAVLLSAGANVLHVKAQDAAGNVAFEEITVQCDS